MRWLRLNRKGLNLLPNIILASQSPRRRELLSNIFPSFSIIPSDADETLPENASPADCAIEIARRKVLDVKSRSDDALIIGADTIVVKDNKILGKPKDEEDAFSMLSALSGGEHTVYTGLVVSYGAKLLCCAEATEVTFRPLTPEMIRAYIKTGEPMDKAGAYGIQQKGAILVDKICGDYFNVVGLPVCRLSKMLEDLGITVL